MAISLEQLKNAVTDIKNDFYEGNDSHSRSEYKGACESLDMLIRHFEGESVMHSYLVTVSESIRKDYLVHAKNEKEAKENYKDGEEGDCKTLEEFVVEVEKV